MSNGSVVAGVEMLFAVLEEHLLNTLSSFAQDAEEQTRKESESHWQDDSGSARDSITGYAVNIDSPDKNFSRSNWAQAQSPGYTSPVWGNPDSNFQPMSEPLDEDIELGVVLTMFVPYAEALENPDQTKADFSNDYEPRERSPRPKVVGGLIENMGLQLTDEFKARVEEAFATVIG